MEKFRIDGREVVAEGRLCRRLRTVTARATSSCPDPESAIAALRSSNTRADLFTFLQKLPETTPAYAYPFEWDNSRSFRINIRSRWTKQLTPRPEHGAARGKKGAVVRGSPFDDSLVQGIWRFTTTPVRQGGLFPHYGQDIETIRKMKELPRSSIFIEGLCRRSPS